MKELFTLADRSRFNPAIDPQAFPGTNSWYWSASPYARNSSYAWYVVFYNGSVFYYNRSNGSRVRCVRESR